MADMFDELQGRDVPSLPPQRVASDPYAVFDRLLDEAQSKQETPAATQPDANDPYAVFDSILDGYHAEQNQRLQSSITQALGSTSERAATTQSLAKSSGLPEDVVERNFDTVAQQVRMRELQSMLADSPILARQFSDPKFAKLAHDDLEQLSAIEKVFDAARKTGQAAQSGYYATGAGVYGTLQAPLDAVAPLFDPLTGTILPENPLRRVSSGISEYQRRLAARAEEAMPEAQGILGSGYYGGIASLSRNLMVMPLAFLPGGQTAALTGMVAPVFGEEYSRARGAGMNWGNALAFGASQGVIEYATERLPLSKLMGDLKAGSPFYKILMRQTALEVPGEQIATVLQDLNEWAVLNPEKPFSSYIAERPSAAAETLIATIVGTGGQTTVMHGVNTIAMRNERKAQNAEAGAQVIEQLNQAAAASKLLQHSPESFEQFIEAATQDGPVQGVYIDAGMLMQSGIAQGLADVSPSIAAQIEEAAATGGSVHIPIAEYATRIAPTEHAAALLDHLKTDPDGFSRSEAHEYMQTQAEQLEAEVEQRIAQQEGQTEFRDSQQRVKDLVLGELNELNRFTDSKNELDATLIAARTAVRAAQLGITPEQLFERQRLQFAAEAITGDTFDQTGNLQTDTPAFQDWFGDSKVVDDSGAPLVVYHGTNADISTFNVEGQGKTSGAGVFFSDNAQVANTYALQRDGANVAPVYLNLKTPMVIDAQGANWDTIDDGAMLTLPDGSQDSLYDYLGFEYGEQASTDDIARVARETGNYDGVIIQNVRDRGPNSTRDMREESNIYVAFEPTQIKSATGNQGTFDSNDPNILHQGQGEPRNLFVAHNLSAENILAATDLGGLAAPSIAIGRSDIGFDSFGEVTLLADPAMLEDRTIRTFDADIYSPRQPRAHYDVDTKAYYEFEQSLDPDGLGLSKPDINEVSGADGADALVRSDAVRLKFLQERGQAPRVYNAKAEPAVRKAAKLDGNRWELAQDPKFIKIATDYYRAEVEQAQALDEGRGERYEGFFFEADGTIMDDAVRMFADMVQRFKDTKGKDVNRFRDDLRDKFTQKKRADEYAQWVTDQFNRMVKGKTLFKGFTDAGNRRYVPYTMDNVVREMTQQLQAGEGSFYGAGTVRSAYANEMRTLDQIRQRRGQIVSEAEFNTLRDESNQVLQDTLEKLKPHYKFDADSWNYSEDAGSAIAEGPKGLREAFDVTPEVQQIVADLVEYLQAMPTTYFEAKARRAMQFSEFDTAVVPKGMRRDALQVLRDAGLKIKTYDPKVEGSRNQVVAGQERLLFQNQRAPRGAYSPDTNTIALLKNADLSTFLHEAGHYFFESDIALASDIVNASRAFGPETMTTGEQQIVSDVSTLLRWHGLQGNIDEQLATWHNLGFEEKRAYHERTAESFERYLFEGKAPSIELQSYFQQFRAWLLNVYRSMKDFLERNPEAGQLSDEVRSVFDRMLATNEEIELAETGRSMMPLFRTQAEADNIGMTPDEFAAYQAQDPQASNDAVQDLQAKGLRDLQWMRNAHNREVKKLQRQAADLRREARIEARREVMSQPVYRAWDFLTRKLEPEDRLASAQRPKSDPNVVDPSQDSLLVAVAKLGGVRKADVVSEWGVDPAERPASGIFGKPVLRATEGLGIDAMREQLAQYGYLDGNHNDPSWNPNEFEERFDAELRGDLQYSNQVSAETLMPEEARAGEGADMSTLAGGRLDLPSLREMGFSEDQINALKARRMTASEGLHPDLVSEMPGIEMTSGDELVQAILEADPPQDAIEALTDARMLEQHGELASPDAIQREADRAIHNETRARMVATEANALARATGQRRILTTAAKQFAQAMVSRIKVRDIRPSTYANAATRAGKAAERASRAGDIVQAGADKRTQLVNVYATRAAHEAREGVDTALRYLSRFSSEGARRGLDVEYLDQIDTLLERFDLRKGQSLRSIDKRKALSQWVADQELAGLEPDIPEYLMHEANRTHYKDLTVEEFQGLVESVRQIEHLGRLKKKLLTAKDQRELDAIVDEIKARIEESSDGREVDNERRATAASRSSHFGRWAMAIHRKAASVVREMDGFEEGGPMWEYFIRSMNAAGDMEADMRAKAARRLHELSQPILKGEEMGGKGRYFPTVERSFNRGERLALALNWGNDGNRQRMLGGRNWTDTQVQPVLDTLTATDWAFVQNVWDFFESYRPEIGAKELRVYGKEPDWIEPTPFEARTADGQMVQMRGGYYPIKYDPLQSGRAAEFAEGEDAKAMYRAAYTSATTRRSFAKTRAEEVHGRPVLLTFDGIWQGANELIHDLSWHEWAIDASRLIKRLDDPIRTHYGAEYVDVLRNSIKDSVRGDIGATNALERSLNHVRVGATVVGLGWNLTTAMLQPLGISQSIVRVGGKWVMKGLGQFYGSPMYMAQKAREIRAMSPLMENRALTMNREINDVRNRLESRSDFKLKMEATFFLLIQKLQAGVDYPTWLGAYEKAMSDPKNDESRAIALADQAVIDSQSGGQIKDLSQVQRGHPAMKLFTNFYSYFNVVMNLTTEQTKKRARDKEYAALAGDYLMIMVVPAVLSGILRQALKGQDDEDEYIEEIFSELIGYPLGMFVGVRETAGAATKIFGIDTQFSYKGPAGLRFFAEIDKLGTQIGQGELDKALFKSMNSVGGLLFHYPAGQVNRMIDGTIHLLEGKTRNPSVLLGGIPY